jgi:hypothetical protein
MEKILVDGAEPPSPGDHIRVRALRDSDRGLAVDRPYRDHPLEITAAEKIDVPSEPGTYEIRGTVKRITLAEATGPDYLVLTDPEVEQVSPDLIEIPREEDEPVWKDRDASDSDVDIDVGSVVSDEETVEEMGTGGSAGVGERLEASYNSLLLRTQ